ncbi:hypothetical protein AB0I81_53095 [Nonomuraea sp. NPDC050404]|uniref:hypothetical protein n=1 Tax=Nonomuraea sp. NPDC050404 TaxID=3155783 RepID=UPI0033C2D0D6
MDLDGRLWAVGENAWRPGRALERCEPGHNAQGATGNELGHDPQTESESGTGTESRIATGAGAGIATGIGPERGGGDSSGLSWRVPVGAGELVVELRPWFLLRTTGLPVRLLDGLGHPGLRRLTERLLAADRRLTAERHRFERRAAPMREAVLSLPAEQRIQARHCMRTVRAGAPLSGAEIGLLESLGLGDWVRRWQRAVVAAGSARAATRRAHAVLWMATRRVVAEAYDEEPVRHAAFLADPAFYRAITRHPLSRRPGDGTARRSRLLTAAAHRHLRRLATGGGDGGPVLYARFDPDDPHALRVAGPVAERAIVEPGDWLTGMLGDPSRVAELRDRYASASWPQRAQHFEDALLAAEPGRAREAFSEVFREARTSPYGERVTIGGPALSRLRAALTAVLPLWCLATQLTPEAAGAVLTRLASEAPLRQGVIRLTAQDIARATADLGARLDPALPAPELMAVGTDLEEATWLLSGLGADCRHLYEGLHGRLHSDPEALRRDLPDVGPPASGHGPPEIDLGAHTPRIMIDDLIYQRARWRLRLPEERGADAFDRWLAIHRLHREHDLPRHAFVRHPADPAPFHVDFCDPLAVEDLARHDPAEVLISEMLPAPGQLWWRVDDQEQCAELRVGCHVHMESG